MKMSLTIAKFDIGNTNQKVLTDIFSRFFNKGLCIGHKQFLLESLNETRVRSSELYRCGDFIKFLYPEICSLPLKIPLTDVAFCILNTKSFLRFVHRHQLSHNIEMEMMILRFSDMPIWLYYMCLFLFKRGSEGYFEIWNKEKHLLSVMYIGLKVK